MGKKYLPKYDDAVRPGSKGRSRHDSLRVWIKWVDDKENCTVVVNTCCIKHYSLYFHLLYLNTFELIADT